MTVAAFSAPPLCLGYAARPSIDVVSSGVRGSLSFHPHLPVWTKFGTVHEALRPSSAKLVREVTLGWLHRRKHAPTVTANPTCGREP